MLLYNNIQIQQLQYADTIFLFSESEYSVYNYTFPPPEH